MHGSDIHPCVSEICHLGSLGLPGPTTSNSLILQTHLLIGRYNLTLAVHLPHHPPHPLSCTALIHAIYDITCSIVVKNCSKSSSVC